MKSAAACITFTGCRQDVHRLTGALQRARCNLHAATRSTSGVQLSMTRAHATTSQPASARETGAVPILLYDGSCGLCAQSVQFVLRHEARSQRLRFATLQGPHGAAALKSNPGLAAVDSVVWLEPST